MALEALDRDTAVLVGRELELSVLDEALANTAAGGSAAVALVGEPGIGKSRLLRELRGRAYASSFEVLAGRGFERERAVPFGLAIDALDVPLDAATSRRVGQAELAELIAVLPTARPPGTASDAEPSRWHHAVHAALKRLARSRPVLIAIDDMHWSDPPSLELLLYLVRHRVPRALIALTYRPHQVLAPPIASTRGLQILNLMPLSPSEAAELVGHKVHAATQQALYAESGGVPLYLEALARSSGRGPRLPFAADRDAEVPPIVATAIAAELGGLPPMARQVLQAAAVVGEPFSADPAGAIAGVDGRALQRALEQLIAADLVRETQVSGQYVFRHPIVRRAVYEATRPGWRLAAHEQAARALAASGAPVDVRAPHIERSASAGDLAAIASLTEAGRAVASRAPAAAARWFAAALELLPESTEELQRRLALLVFQAEALSTSGDLHACRDVLQRALELMPARPTTERSRILTMIARTERGLGRGDAARRLLTGVEAHVEPGGREMVKLNVELSASALLAGELEQAGQLAVEARTVAQALGERTLLLRATAALGWWAAYSGALATARSCLADAAADIDQLEDHELDPGVLEVMASLVYAEISMDRLDGAVRYVERGLRVSRATGQGHALARFIQGEAITSLFQGRLEDARRAADTAVETAELLSNDQFLGGAEMLRCWCATLRGDLAAAAAAGKAAVAAGERGSSLFTWLARLCYGEALVQAGQADRGRDEILAAGGTDLVAIIPAFHTLWLRALVTAELAAGRLEDAERATRRAEATAAVVQLPSSMGAALSCRASVLLAREQYEEAAATALRAVHSYDTAGNPLSAAQARLLAGRALAAAGSTAASQRELGISHATFDACGAARLADLAAKELRALGKRVARSRSRPGVVPGRLGTLSGREHEVAVLVARGYTNRAVAAELFLSEKTVEKHLARVFAKLNVSSRTAVAALVGRWDTEGRELFSSGLLTDR